MPIAPMALPQPGRTPPAPITTARRIGSSCRRSRMARSPSPTAGTVSARPTVRSAAPRRGDNAMRKSFVLAVASVIVLIATALPAQQPQKAPGPWRGAGATPCVGPDGGVFQCPPAPRVIAVRAGRLFDSKTGQMLTRQVVLLHGRAHHGGRTGGSGQDSGRRAGDRPQPGDGPARPDRRAHAHVQHRGPEHARRKRRC